jgi:hypothetical protein
LETSIKIFNKNNSPFYSIQGFSNPYMRNGGIGASATWGGYGQPQPQQPSGIGASATWGGYGQPQPQQPSGIGASATWGGYGQPQPQPQPSYPYSSYPQMPSYGGIGASATWGGYQVGGSAGYYPNGNYGQYNPSKPNYNQPEYEDEDEDSEAEDKPEIGAVVVESGNSGQMNGGLNWNNGGGMNWVRSKKIGKCFPQALVHTVYSTRAFGTCAIDSECACAC